MTTNTFSYNGLDTRVGVTDSLGSRSFKRNGIGVTAPVLSDGLAHYTPSGEVRSGVKTTFHSAVKNTDIQTSSSGAVASSRVYDAFGNDLSVTGSWKSPFGYAGQFGYQQDVDTGLKLLGHRYYDSDTGRFLTRDPIKDGRNWYGYCGNAPVKQADPSGLAWHDPMVVYVDPGFGGQVIVIGEPGKGKPQSSGFVPAGYHSAPTVDVDYVIVVHPDGRQTKSFAWGLATPLNPVDVTQYAYVDSKGRLSAPGPISDDWFISAIDVGWMLKLNKALDYWELPAPVPGNPFPKQRRPSSKGPRLTPHGFTEVGGRVVAE